MFYSDFAMSNPIVKADSTVALKISLLIETSKLDFHIGVSLFKADHHALSIVKQ